MSRAYRIRVSDTQRRVIRAGDEVRTSLGLLEILPPEQMAALLERELTSRGFRKDGTVLRRDDGGVRVTVDPATGAVTANSDVQEETTLRSHRDGLAYEDFGPAKRSVRRELNQRVREDLERQAVQQTEELQRQATDRLEGRLLDLKKELDHAVNRATAEALKRKAAQLGRIQSIEEDAASGEVTITVEV